MRPIVSSGIVSNSKPSLISQYRCISWTMKNSLDVTRAFVYTIPKKNRQGLHMGAIVLSWVLIVGATFRRFRCLSVCRP